jgi:hypothetical protein
MAPQKRGFALLRLAVLAALFACRERPTQQARQAAGAPPATAPADISHGEAPVGSSAEPPPVDPAAPPRSVGRLHTVRIEIRHAKIAIAPGVTYDAWTFGGQVPGPVIRVTTGRAAEYARHPIKVRVGEAAPNVRCERGPEPLVRVPRRGGNLRPRLSRRLPRASPRRRADDERAGGGGVIFEARLVEQGTYPFVSHAFADSTKGAVGMFEATP